LDLVTAENQLFGVEVRVSFVAYRDYCDRDRILDSIDSVEEHDVPRAYAKKS
jgi:hypothetical protein